LSLDAYTLIVFKNRLISAPNPAVISLPDASCAYVLLFTKINDDLSIFELSNRNSPIIGAVSPDVAFNLYLKTFIAVDELPTAPVGPVGPVQPVGPVVP
jgi:hypothetical protein